MVNPIGFEAQMFIKSNTYNFKIYGDTGFAFSDETKKLSKKETKEVMTQIGLDIFSKITAAEMGGTAPVGSIKIAKANVKDTLFTILANETGLSEKEVIQHIKAYTKENPQEVKNLVKEIALTTNFKMNSKKLSSAFFIKLLYSNHSFDLLKSKIPKGSSLSFGDAFRLINYVRCQIAARMFHLDIHLHEFVLSTGDMENGVAFEQNRIHAFDPATTSEKIHTLVLAQGQRMHLAIMDSKSPETWQHFIQPTIIQKTNPLPEARSD